MRFVAVKTREQQARGMLFRTRDLLVRQRTQTINALRGHFAEFGVIAPRGPAHVERLAEAVEDHRPDNPAADLKWLLPNVRKVPNHRASLPYRQAPEAMAEWQALSINPAVKLAVLFIVLTAARRSEATDVIWSEVDLPERVWRVPAPRMKARRDHEVPLSWQALEVLLRARELQRSDSLIFALRGSNGAARPPGQRTVSDALRTVIECAVKGAIPQRVRIPPGNCRSSR